MTSVRGAAKVRGRHVEACKASQLCRCRLRDKERLRRAGRQPHLPVFRHYRVAWGTGFSGTAKIDFRNCSGAPHQTQWHALAVAAALSRELSSKHKNVAICIRCLLAAITHSNKEHALIYTPHFLPLSFVQSNTCTPSPRFASSLPNTAPFPGIPQHCHLTNAFHYVG